ncbi:hypothetical protein C1H46_027126 [Malus baccata]|uniref:Uncharacterized protein n=1 Tax=Malus baccata TaxID=106549 RepID=A0A540LLH7_MALBA|nr:hypothetical protein C1H46_027126 [Malus baccata]
MVKNGRQKRTKQESKGKTNKAFKSPTNRNETTTSLFYCGDIQWSTMEISAKRTDWIQPKFKKKETSCMGAQRSFCMEGYHLPIVPSDGSRFVDNARMVTNKATKWVPKEVFTWKDITYPSCPGMVRGCCQLPQGPDNCNYPSLPSDDTLLPFKFPRVQQSYNLYPQQ